MADLLGIDPARIERLRDPKRLEQVDPGRIWNVVPNARDGLIVDVGAGVGYVSLPAARRFPAGRVVACDVLPEMLAMLEATAHEENLPNLQCLPMSPTTIPLEDASADLLLMLQVHHELDEPIALLGDCRRVLKPGATIAIIDWKDVDAPGCPGRGRRVPEPVIRSQLDQVGFMAVHAHPVYELHTFLTARTT